MTKGLDLVRLLILGLLLVSGNETDGSEASKCPSYCTCDLYDNLNRADCSGQRLISGNVEVPSAVELLDLSYNDITTLDNACFEGLIYVDKLGMAHNALHTIYLDAFSPLIAVTSIDLSFNRLEYFDDRIFETNRNLLRLDLSGNKFMSLLNKPLLKSASIQHLRLHDAQIAYIYPSMFAEMPALREIDLSTNLMITMATTPFVALRQLVSINLEQNRWICDKGLDATIQFLKKRSIDVKLSSCAMFEKPKMFERMMAAPPTADISKESTSIEDVWKPKKSNDLNLDKTIQCEEQSIVKVCQLHRNCLANIELLMKDKVVVDTKGQYTGHDLNFVFLTGICLGMTFVAWCVTCGLCLKRCCATKKRIQQIPHELGVQTRVVNITPPHRPIPPPIPQRHRRRSSRRSAPPPPINRSLSSPARRGPPATNQSDFATFVSRLFERPSRHQYYRTINENTAHMIRRLSQSNLFNNRLSQHFSGARNSNNEQSQQAAPLLFPQSTENRSQSDQPEVHISNSDTVTTLSVRPETPPPAYRDVIKPNEIV